MAKHKISVGDMQVARVYADAAFASASATGQANDLADEFEAIITQIVDKDPEHEGFFLAPLISREERQGVLDRACEGRVSDSTYKLLTTLNHHDRLNVIRAVAVQLRTLAAEAAGEVRATVTTATPLNSEQTNRLEKLLADGLKGTPRVQYRVDPTVLGGLKVAVGETVYDETVQSNLGRLREGLLARSVQ